MMLLFLITGQRIRGRWTTYARRCEWPVRVICNAAFGRGIPAGIVAPPSNTPGMLSRRASPSGRRAPKSALTTDTDRPLALQQPQAGRVGDGGGSRRHVQLRQGIGDVPVHGVLADGQAIGDGLVA